MFILVTVVLLFVTALALLVLRLVRPQFRFAWLIAVGATFLAWITVFVWRPLLPLSLSFGAWEPSGLLSSAPALLADQFSWVYAISLVVLALSTLLTATIREAFPDPAELSVSLASCALGLVAVTAANPLTLALAWAALDMIELVILLSITGGREGSRRVVTAFSIKAAAVVLLMLAQVSGSAPATRSVGFASVTPQVALLLLVAAGLRLAALPRSLPQISAPTVRRGIETGVRMVSAAAGLVLLSRMPVETTSSFAAVLILIVLGAAGLYASWMWLRAPDELAGRPFWIMGVASLALFCALRGNPTGAAAWGVALILAGSALFLSSAQQVWLSRLLFLGVWTISALPFSVTATGWNGQGGFVDLALPVFIIIQALQMAGFVRHALRPAARASLKAEPAWTRSAYPAGIGLLLLTPLLLGIGGWDGAFQFGTLIPGIAAGLLAAALLWAVPRFPILNPIPAHWLRPSSDSGLDRLSGAVLGVYRWFEGASRTISYVLEGDAGLMWTLLFLVLFIVMIVQRSP